MGFGVIFIIIAILALLIWFSTKFKHTKHKFIAIFLVFILVAGYLSASYVLKDRNIDYGTVSGLIEATQIYFGWLSYAFGNMKSITSNAVKMDWEGNSYNQTR